MPNGTNKNDFYFGNDAANKYSGLGGNDTIFGYGGNDTLYGNSGDDFFEPGAGIDQIYGGTGNDTVSYASATGGVFASLAEGWGYNQILGVATDKDFLVGIENITGSVHDDFLEGNAKANVLSGGSGNDAFTGDAGADTLDGGIGFDKVYYTSSATGVVVDLVLGTGHGGAAEGDTLISIEEVLGSYHSDTISADGLNNTLFGYAGNDTLKGRGGSDFMGGDEGKDKLYGGNGDDTLAGGIGADRLDGGKGNDTADYSSTGAGVTADLKSGHATGADEGAGDTLISIENFVGGYSSDKAWGTDGDNILSDTQYGDDVFHGRGGNDTLIGGRDYDKLYGDAGNDTLVGGIGTDTLSGGTGLDKFVFYANDSGNDFAFRDVITDFSGKYDHIDFSSIDANDTTGADDKFTFVGTNSLTSGPAGQVHYFIEGNHTVIEADMSGDGVADFQIELNGIHALTSFDFIF